MTVVFIHVSLGFKTTSGLISRDLTCCYTLMYLCYNPLYSSLHLLSEKQRQLITYRLYLSLSLIVHFKVVMGSHFSEGGAAQIHHDITKGLVALLSHYCDDIASRQLLER